MAKKHIGFVIFGICSALSARLAVFEPKPRVLTPAEERWGMVAREQDMLGFLQGMRYYIYGIGVVGLLIVAEDYITERLSKKAKNPENVRGNDSAGR